MLSRLIFIFSLIASFGLAQMGAVTHEISHYADTNSQNLQQDSEQKNTNQKNAASHQHSCEKCLGYAELSGSITNTPQIILPFTTDTSPLNGRVLYFNTPQKLRPYSARAPPTLA